MQSVRQQRQISDLVTENHTLKLRLAKLGEIESYIDVLVQNNKNYQDEISILQSENRKLRNHMEEAVADRLHGQSSHQSEIVALKKNQDFEINELLSELKGILRDREEMQINHRNIIEELQLTYTSDLQRRRSEMQEVDLDYQNRITKLSSIVREQQRDLEILSRQLKETKIYNLDDVEAMSSQIRQISQKNQFMETDLNKNVKQIELLARQNRQLISENEKISTRCLTIQQDKNDVILEIKKDNKKLITELDKVNLNLKAVQKGFDDCQTKLTGLSAENQQLRRERNDLQSQGRRSLRMIEQTEYVLAGTQEKQKIGEEHAQRENMRNRQHIQELEKGNQQMRRKLDEANSQREARTAEIKDLLMSLEKMDTSLINSEKQVGRLYEINIKLTEKTNYDQSEIEGSQLEIRSLRQKLALYQSHNATLQEMVEKQKRKGVMFQADRRDSGKIADCERQISKKYELEIKLMVEEFFQQKTAMIQEHNQQRQKLKALYEYTLANKEDLFNRKLELLESEIDAMRTHI